MFNTICAQHGASFMIKEGERLSIRSPEGEQVSDLFCFNAHDYGEMLSASRSLDEAESIFLSTGNSLVSNRARPMLKILSDSCGRHDLLMPPCRESENGHRGCFENLSSAFLPFGISADQVGTAFNVFMHVELENGRLVIRPPQSKAGDEIIFEAQMDLLVGLTACAHLQTNGGRLRPIQWAVNPQI